MLPTPQAAAGQQASQKKTGCKGQSGQAKRRKRRFHIQHHTSDGISFIPRKALSHSLQKTKILSKCAMESARKNVPFGSDNVQDLLGSYASNSALNP